MFSSSSRRADPPQSSGSSSMLNRSFSIKSFSKSSGGGGHQKSKSTNSFSSTTASGGIRKRRHESVSGGSISSRQPPTANANSSFGPMSLDVSMTGSNNNPTSSSIITIVVGGEQRIFAAHQDVLCTSPFFLAALRGAYPSTTPGFPPTPTSPISSASTTTAAWSSPLASGSTKRIALPEEEPEIFSSVLEFLYKGDYYPRLVHNKRKNSWELEVEGASGSGSGNGGGRRSKSIESTVYLRGVDGDLLKDTVIYCAAHRYGLDELKKIALRKQGLQSGIQCSTILASARYAYDHTPDSDARLRAHYLALIIRSRDTFKRSGTMQMEMLNGGSPLFFDLFVALCNHVDDVSAAGDSTPKNSKHF